VDRFEIDSTRSGTVIRLAKLLPARSPFWGPREIARLGRTLAEQRPEDAIGEVQRQNQELLRTLEALRTRQEEVERVNRELEDTNRGVVALYAELDERADHLRRADEVKTRFLSNMTHEFRTPVNSILALSRLLGERLGQDETDKNEVFYIRKAAQQLSDLVDDLLDLAKVEAGKIDVRPTHFDVKNLFGALRGMLRPLLVGQSLTLVFEDPVDIPSMYTDESKVSQILRNFISNALKYTETGEVRVTARFDRERAAVEFAVSDTGIGIPDEDQHRIFDEFVQIENPLQRRVKGTGLGLPLSQRLAGLLHGRITVESALGVGSTFRLTVPAVYRAPATLAITAPLPPGQLALLAIEDSDEDVLVYHRILAGSRFELVHARSVEAAQHTLAAVTPAAILLDIRLNGQDAWDFLVRLKRERQTAAVPVVVISTTDNRRKAFGLGADGFGLKPIERAWLLQTLDTLAHRHAKLRVLAIDDEEAFRFIVRESLPASDYELAEARSGTEGVALAREFHPDVILLDLQLPDISGFDVSDRLDGDALTSHVPVVVVTSHRLTSQDEARLRSVRHVVSKSTVSRELLRGVIRDAVLAHAPRPARMQ